MSRQDDPTSTVTCKGSTICQIISNKTSTLSSTPTVAQSFQESKCCRKTDRQSLGKFNTALSLAPWRSFHSAVSGAGKIEPSLTGMGSVRAASQEVPENTKAHLHPLSTDLPPRSKDMLHRLVDFFCTKKTKARILQFNSTFYCECSYEFWNRNGQIKTKTKNCNLLI